MKLFVVQVVNGNMTIKSEWTENEKGAKVAFHQLCAALWNADDVYDGEVKILDDQMNTFAGYAEHITHPQPEPEPEPEPEEEGEE